MALMPLTRTAAENADSVAIQFYLQQARNTFESTYIFGLKRNFTCRAVATATLTNYRGKLDRVDSSAYDITYSDGRISGIDVSDTAGMSQNIIPDLIISDMPWQLDCEFYFFPNDTGGSDISIGFEPRDASVKRAASGYITMDRYNYMVKSYTIYMTNHQFSDRYSRVYVFDYKNLLTRPVFLERHWREGGFWGRKYFHQRITIVDYRLGE
jgi:hypothetical protein